jgi:hypothetical protein
MGKNRSTAVNKLAAEAAYLALKCRFVCMFPTEIPPFEYKALIERVAGKEADMLHDLFAARIADKNAEYIKTDEYNMFITETEELSEAVKDKISSNLSK